MRSQTDKIYEAVKDKIANAKEPVRVGEVNQDATSANITERGLGFINRFIELAEADGKKCAVVGNDYYKNLVEGTVAEGEADIIIEVAGSGADNCRALLNRSCGHIMNKEDTIAIFGSNQVSAEGVLTAKNGNNLNVLGKVKIRRKTSSQQDLTLVQLSKQL